MSLQGPRIDTPANIVIIDSRFCRRGGCRPSCRATEPCKRSLLLRCGTRMSSSQRGCRNLPPASKIFVSKMDPGAGSCMAGDQFGPKKPSISPYMNSALTWQTSSWLKNGDFFQKKMVLVLWSIADSRIHLFWLSWAHMKAVIYA